MQQPRLPIIRKLRIDVAVSDKEIDPAVVVVIEKLSAPADVRQTRRRNLRGV